MRMRKRAFIFLQFLIQVSELYANISIKIFFMNFVYTNEKKIFNNKIVNEKIILTIIYK